MMWPFSGEKLSDPVNLPNFDSTKKCPACGGTEFIRRFSPAIREIGLPDRIQARCACGWYRNEKMKSDSEVEE